MEEHLRMSVDTFCHILTGIAGFLLAVAGTLLVARCWL